MTMLTLNDGRSLPQLGLGTYQIPDSQVAAVVRRGLDTAIGWSTPPPSMAMSAAWARDFRGRMPF